MSEFIFVKIGPSEGPCIDYVGKALPSGNLQSAVEGPRYGYASRRFLPFGCHSFDKVVKLVSFILQFLYQAFNGLSPKLLIFALKKTLDIYLIWFRKRNNSLERTLRDGKRWFQHYRHCWAGEFVVQHESHFHF